MDILAHGLWTNALYEAATRGDKPLLRRSERNRWLAVLFGIAPDLVSFGPVFIFSFLSKAGWKWLNGPPGPTEIPAYITQAYSWTHSLVIFGAAVLAVYVLSRKIFWPMFGWLLHILIDIPSHSMSFFPTPFWWPLSEFRFNGLRWADPWFMAINYSALMAIYLILYVFRLRKKI